MLDQEELKTITKSYELTKRLWEDEGLSKNPALCGMVLVNLMAALIHNTSDRAHGLDLFKATVLDLVDTFHREQKKKAQEAKPYGPLS